MPIGPQLPPHLARAATPSDNEEDNYSPALPPDLAAKRGGKRDVGPAGPAVGPRVGSDVGPAPPSGPSRPPGPSLPGPNLPGPSKPPPGPSLPEDDSDDDFVGPSLADMAAPDAQKSAADEFREREERKAELAAKAAAAPKVTQRDDWMLAPPPSGALASLDPSRRPTGFQKTSKQGVSAEEQSGWTETPAQRAEREKEEALGMRRRGEGVPEDLERKRRRERDEEIRRQVEGHKSTRGPSLLDQHKAKKAKGEEEHEVIWDHDKMMGVTGRLLTDQERDKKVRDARGLSDRFGHSKSGAYM